MLFRPSPLASPHHQQLSQFATHAKCFKRTLCLQGSYDSVSRRVQPRVSFRFHRKNKACMPKSRTPSLPTTPIAAQSNDFLDSNSFRAGTTRHHNTLSERAVRCAFKRIINIIIEMRQTSSRFTTGLKLNTPPFLMLMHSCIRPAFCSMLGEVRSWRSHPNRQPTTRVMKSHGDLDELWKRASVWNAFPRTVHRLHISLAP